MASPTTPSGRGSGPTVRAGSLLRNPKLWLAPSVLAGLVALLLSLLYMGGIIDPNGNLHRLPVALVNADTGTPPPGQRENLGAQVVASVTGASPTGAVNWHQVTEARAQELLASGKVYGALVIPSGFTAAVTSLSAGQAAARPTITVLTNPGLGSLGSSLVSQINQGAARAASLGIGKQLSAAPAAAASDPAARLLLADPVAVTTKVGHPIGSHSGLGLSAFYYTLLLVLSAFITANMIHSGVDTALGYADGEIGPWHTRRPTVPISRTQTLVLKMVMTAGILVLTTTLVMVACTAVLGMDASHLPLLWVFSYCACLAVGLGVQSINAAFGSLGQLVSMFVFIALALPSSGATVPLEAVPSFYRFLGEFEPMRQVSGGVRAILYFDARVDAGLARAWTMIAVGAAVALLFGWAMVHYYDRKGLKRLTPQP